jgi:hypothetical protein
MPGDARLAEQVRQHMTARYCIDAKQKAALIWEGNAVVQETSCRGQR